MESLLPMEAWSLTCCQQLQWELWDIATCGGRQDFLSHQPKRNRRLHVFYPLCLLSMQGFSSLFLTCHSYY
ncbi:hypothetical protein MA16_Dca028300 [Dendrobium catenatum]|uniref:Uncharacterized protein n=1 Tax=Dendrobium catenatum TaxID=906689 RepID=A0A2I0VDC0_9ASPA|nr:hypothetical protein MA16_Dca028300 [Dendrobium catenatum]